MRHLGFNAGIVSTVSVMAFLAGMGPAEGSIGTLAAAHRAALFVEHAAGANIAKAPAQPSAFPEPPATVAAASVGYLPESWTVSSAGAFVDSIPMAVPPGRANMQPSLTLSYSSEGGNGSLGVGWSLGVGSSITHCAQTFAVDGRKRGVDYGGDTFCLDGQRLMPKVTNIGSGYDDEYRPESDPRTSVRSQGSDALGPSAFEVRTADGHTRHYDAVTAMRMQALADAGAGAATPGSVVEAEGEVRVEWVLTRETDREGNFIAYEYAKTPSGIGADAFFELVPLRIRYTGSSLPGVPDAAAQPQRSVEFVYEDRPDVAFGWTSGVRYGQTRRLKSVVMSAPNPVATSEVWRYSFGYQISGGSKRSLLIAVDESTAAGGHAWQKQFDWSASGPPQFAAQPVVAAPGAEFHHAPDATVDAQSLKIADLNGDGLSDVVYFPGGTSFSLPASTQSVWLGKRDSVSGDVTPLGDGAYAVDPYDPESAYGQVTLDSAYPVDVDGDGASELFVNREIPTSYTCWTDPANNLGPTWNCGYPKHSWQTVHWDDIGKTFVAMAPSVESNLVKYRADVQGSPYYRAPAVIFADVNGDGLADLLYSAQVGEPVDADGEFPYLPGFWSRLNSGAQPGAFQPAAYSGSAMWTASVADIDGDGRDDVIVGQGNAITADGPGDSVVAVRSPVPVDANPSNRLFPAAFPGTRFADFNGDGLEDALICPEDQNNLLVHSPMACTLQWNSGNGFYAASQSVFIPFDEHPDRANGIASAFEDRGLRIADVDGDGRADIVVFRNDPQPAITMLLSQGDGTFLPVDRAVQAGDRMDAKVVDVSQISAGTHYPDAGWTIFGEALNLFFAPGCSAMVLLTWSNLDPTELKACLDPPAGGQDLPPVPADQLPGMAPGWVLADIGDFNGDGFPDFIRHVGGEGGGFEILQQAPQLGDRIVRVYDEPTAWPREEIAYSGEWSDAPGAKTAYACKYPLRCIHGGLTVVRSVTSRIDLVDPVDPAKAGRTTYYSYEDPVADTRGRGYLGFGEVRIWDPAEPSETILQFDHRKRQVLQNGREYYPNAGQATTTTVVRPILGPNAGQPSAATARITQSRLSLDLVTFDGGLEVSPLAQKTEQSVWEQTIHLTWNGPFDEANDPRHYHLWDYKAPAAPLLHASATSTYDDFANVAVQTTKTDKGVTQTVTTTYDNRHGFSEWMLGLPLSKSMTWLESDKNATAQTRAVSYHQNDLGQLDTIWVAKDDADDSMRSTATIAYSVYGLPTTTTKTVAGEPPRTTHVEYAPICWTTISNGADIVVCPPDEEMFPAQTWADHDNPDCPPGKDCRPSAWVLTDPAYGTPWITMDLNGVKTVVQHDGLGRAVFAQSDGELPVSISVDARSDAFGGKNGLVVTTTAGQQQSVTTADALGRTLSTAFRGFDGSLVRTKTEFDALGRVARSYRPYTSAQPGPATTYTYDSLNRPLQVTGPDGSQSSTSYPTFFKTVATSPRGSVSYTILDNDGRVRTSANTVGPPGPCKPACATYDVKTSFTYAAFGQLDSVTDDQGHVTKKTYDALGRLRSEDDPDRGVSTFAYNGFDELKQTVHAASGETESLVYDDLGRIIQRTTADGVSAFVFDAGPFGIGRPAWDQSPDGIVRKYRYDAFGRPAGVDLIDDKNHGFSVDFGYEPGMGRLQTLAYPEVPGRPRFTVQYAYNAWGYLNGVDDATPGQPAEPLWHVDARTADLALADGRLGKNIGVHRDYDPNSGRLTDLITTQIDTSATLLSTGYDYWSDGLVKTRSSNDGARQRQESFDYDAMSRLTKWTLGVAKPAPMPQYGAMPDTGYVYDTLGNLHDVTKTISGQTQVAEQRTYDPSRPHQLTQLTAGGVAATYQYDARGRMFSDDSGQTTRTLAYNAFDLPATIMRGGNTWTLKYDAGGQRIRKTGIDGDTISLPGLYERRELAGDVEHVFHVQGTDGAVAQVTYDEGAPAATTAYPLTDALGSTAAVADADGNITQRDYYDPFGQRTDAEGAAIDTPNLSGVHEGFTGQEHEEALGLINFRGRLYDPAMKRFLSPDPVVSAPAFSQSWNPYSYVMNSPLNLTDPSGFKPACYQIAMSIGDGPETVVADGCRPSGQMKDFVEGQRLISLGFGGAGAPRGTKADDQGNPWAGDGICHPSCHTPDGRANQPGPEQQKLFRQFAKSLLFVSAGTGIAIAPAGVIAFARVAGIVAAAANLATLPSHDDPAAPGAIIGAVCCGWNAYRGTKAAIDVPVPTSDKLINFPDPRIPDAAELAARAAQRGGDRIFYVDRRGIAQAARFTQEGVTFDSSLRMKDDITPAAIDEWLARNPDKDIAVFTGVHGVVMDRTPGSPGFKVPTGEVGGIAPSRLSSLKYGEQNPGGFSNPDRVMIFDVGGDISRYGPEDIGGLIDSMEQQGFGVCRGWCLSTFSDL